MRRRFAIGWGLVAVGVIVVSVLVTSGAIRAHGQTAFNRWVGWATIVAVPFAAIGIVLVIFEKIARSREATERRADAPLSLPDAQGVLIGNDSMQVSPGSQTADEMRQDSGNSPRTPESSVGTSNDAVRRSAYSKRIAFWGPVASGKTTYLAALDVALRKATPPWTLTGLDKASTDSLSELTAGIVERSCFPNSTHSIDSCWFTMTGSVAARTPRWSRRQGSPTQLQFDLGVVDPTGELFLPDRIGLATREKLIDEIANCDGIVLFFDPTREMERKDAYRNFQSVAKQLEHVMRVSGGSRLPHYVAVCITKFDDPRVLAAALEAGHLVKDSNDPYEFPRVADNCAADFMDELYRKANPGGAKLFRYAIERYFHQERIRYFTISSIGFFMDSSMRFHFEDYYNIVDAGEDGLAPRGDIYPINVLEPLLWLADPERYEAVQRRRDFIPLRRREQPTGRPSQEGPAARQNRHAATLSAPGLHSVAPPAHLICMLEISGPVDAVQWRLDGFQALADLAVQGNPELRVSLITYGPHSFSSNLAEAPVTVVAWACDRPHLQLSYSLLHHLACREGAGPEYQLSAQIECALAEVSRRLEGSHEQAVLVTMGSRPASPRHMAVDSLTLPCPARNDWRELIQGLRDDHAIILGAIRDSAIPSYYLDGHHADNGSEVWSVLGAHGISSTDEMDISRFAADLGLRMPAQIMGDPPPRQERLADLLRGHGREGGLAEEPPALPNGTSYEPGSEIPLSWDED